MFEWDEMLSVGDATLDGTHKVFLNLLNKTLMAGDEAFEKAFKMLIDQTREHFAYEEQQILLLQMPTADAHLEAHRQILDEMDLYRMKALGGREEMVLHYLRDVLPGHFRRHTMTMDTELARHI